MVGTIGHGACKKKRIIYFIKTVVRVSKNIDKTFINKLNKLQKLCVIFQHLNLSNCFETYTIKHESMCMME